MPLSDLPTENQLDQREAELRARRFRPVMWSGHFTLSREEALASRGSTLPRDEHNDPPSDAKRIAGSKGGKKSAAKRWNTQRFREACSLASPARELSIRPSDCSS